MKKVAAVNNKILPGCGMHRILFIDDDPKAQTMLKMILDGMYAVTPALTGEEGIRIVRNEDPDVVLLDINLPDQDGLEVLKKIVAMPAAPPVAMLTYILN